MKEGYVIVVLIGIACVRLFFKNFSSKKKKEKEVNDKLALDKVFNQMDASSDIAALDMTFHETLSANPKFYDEILKTYKVKRAFLLGEKVPAQSTVSTLPPKEREQRARKLWLSSFIVSAALSLLFSFFSVEEIYAREKFNTLLRGDEKFKKEMGLYLDKGYSKEQIFRSIYQQEVGEKLLIDSGLYLWVVSTSIVFLSVGGWFCFFTYKKESINLNTWILMAWPLQIIVIFLEFTKMAIGEMNVIPFLISFLTPNVAWALYILCCIHLKKIKEETKASILH